MKFTRKIVGMEAFSGLAAEIGGSALNFPRCSANNPSRPKMQLPNQYVRVTNVRASIHTVWREFPYIASLRLIFLVFCS